MLVGYPMALGAAQVGLIFVVSGFVDLFGDADVAARFVVAGALIGASGWVGLRRLPGPSVTSAPTLMTMTTVAFLTLIAGGAAAHLLADVTNGVDAAVFEGTAAATTTAMTGLDPDGLPMGLHMFRSLMQWTGGLAALVVALILVPLVFGGRELIRGGQSERGDRAIITGWTRGARNIVLVYGVFTVVMLIAYLAAGMGLFDSVAHAMTTVSTGGLSTRTASIGAFDSSAIEWVAVGGMAVAGLNVGAVWWVVRGDHKALRRSSELRAFLIVMVLSIVVVSLWLNNDYPAAESIRTSAVAVVSAMSTTGFSTSSWAAFDNGAQTLLVVLLGIGAMSGSAGGGFRYIRVIEAFRFAARELKRQLHPSAVGVVCLNGRAVSERTLERLTAYMVVLILVVAAGGMLIELGDSQVTPGAALALSISAVSTAGPQVIDPVALGDLGPVSKLSIAVLMLLGRLSVYIVILSIINAVARVVSTVQNYRWACS